MRKSLVVAATVSLLALAVALAVTCIWSPTGHYDFSLRLSEVACVRQRVNPYDVWRGAVDLPPYYPNTHVGEPPTGCTKPVNAYAPWAYVVMLPLSFLSEEGAWTAYCVLMVLAFALLLWLPWRTATEDPFLQAVIPALIVAYPIWSNTAVGNFALIVLSASVAMAWVLNRGHDVLGGVCWAIVMLKPQVGLVFAIPLLMRRKWTVLFVAGGLCLLLSLAAAVICRASVVDMLRHGPAANTSFFLGCGTWPYFLCSEATRGRDILAGLVVGALVCAALTALVRRERDWFVFLMPAAITSCCWTYTQAYSHAMGWFVAFVLVRALLRHPQSRFLWALAALAACSLSRGFLAWHGLVAFAGWTFPLSDYAFRCWDSLNSTLSLGLAAAQCVWLWQTGPCPSGAAGRALGDPGRCPRISMVFWDRPRGVVHECSRNCTNFICIREI